ncbi:MAG: GatB/YqeY domain-containing protein [Pseudomonadota bacterium]
MRDRINAALKDAMRARDEVRTSTLRLMLACIKDRDIAARSEEGAVGLDEAGLVDLLAKMIKQREESARVYEEAGRMELAERERSEIAVIRGFLPKPLTEAEVSQAIDRAIAETGASSIRDIGKVMGALRGRFAGRMDFGKAGAQVKAVLG